MDLKEITTALDQLDLSKYELIKKEEIADIHSAGLLLKHKKSGARVVVLSNDDENKVFSIGFKTPPFNDTGLQHIMEHSTLCGSRKYPVKDPFVELCKGSLNTFLNAMTRRCIRWQAVIWQILRILRMSIWMRYFIRISIRESRFLSRRAGITN